MYTDHNEIMRRKRVFLIRKIILPITTLISIKLLKIIVFVYKVYKLFT